jgi:hypothetical protein
MSSQRRTATPPILNLAPCSSAPDPTNARAGNVPEKRAR